MAETKTNKSNSLLKFSYFTLFQSFLIIILCIKIYFLNKKNEFNAINFQKDGESLFNKYENKIEINKNTFIGKFETFMQNISKESFYEMPATPDGRKRELGKAGWILLHNIAIKYPHIPTDSEMKDLAEFLRLFGKLYPCAECRPHFKKMISENPPNFENNLNFNKWLCKVHNIVNRRIGNKEFDCSKLEDRWDCGCKLDSFQ